MAELEDVLTALRNAHEAGDTVAAQRLAQIADQMRRGQDSERPSPMMRVNRGIARSLGAPVDVVSAGLRAAGVDVGDAPLGGSESIMRGMERLGSRAVTRDAPETLGQAALEGVGEAAGALLPVGALARGLQGAGPVARGAADTVMRPFIATPARAMGAEMAAGAGARVGEEYARQEGRGPIGQVVGAVIGGAAGAMAPGAALRATSAIGNRLPVAGAIMRGARAAVVPFTEAGARVRASDRLRGLVADPEGVARAADEATMSNLTPGQATREPGLLALERTIADTYPDQREAMTARASEASETLRGALREPAQGQDIEALRQFIDQRRATFRSNLDARRQAAERAAQSRVQQLDPARRETEASAIVRDYLDRAFEGARREESQLWARVPMNARVPVDHSRTVLSRIVEQTGEPQRVDIPAEATRYLGDGGWPDSVSARDMHGLYSRMRQVAREASAGQAPNENRARIANLVAEAILEDLGATGADVTDVGRAINVARTYTREMNEVFGQGTVGNILARRITGGDAIAPETTLARTVGQGGAQGAVAVDDIRRAVGSDADPAIQDFLRNRVTDAADRRQGFNAERAETFVRGNRETLQRFPELGRDIGAAQAGVRRAEGVDARVTDILRRLENPRENVSAAFLAANAGDEIAQAVFRARNPAQAALSLRRAAARDPSGDAMASLKGGFLDFLIGRAGAGYDDAGRQIISGDTLNGIMQDPRSRQAIARVFDAAEMSRIDRIAREFQGLDAARRAGRLDRVMDDAPNSVISFLVRTVAARQGAAAGQGTSGASLLTAGFASRRAQEILYGLTNDRAERLLIDAISDPDLFRALMTRGASSQAQVERRLVEWAMGTAATQVPQED